MIIHEKLKIKKDIEINDMHMDITRTCSLTSLYIDKKDDGIFVKSEELFSEDEDYSKNSFINGDINLRYDHNNIYLEINKNQEKINNYYYNYNEINKENNSIKYPEKQLLFLDKS